MTSHKNISGSVVLTTVSDNTVNTAAATENTSKRRIRRNVWSTRDDASGAATSQPRALTSAGARKLNVNRRNDTVSMTTSQAVADDDDDMFVTKSTSNTRGLFGKPAAAVTSLSKASDNKVLFGKKLTADSERPLFGKMPKAASSSTSSLTSSAAAKSAKFSPIFGPDKTTKTTARKQRPVIGRSPLLRQQQPQQQQQQSSGGVTPAITPIAVRSTSVFAAAAASTTSASASRNDGDDDDDDILEIPVTPLAVKTTASLGKLPATEPTTSGTGTCSASCMLDISCVYTELRIL